MYFNEQKFTLPQLRRLEDHSQFYGDGVMSAQQCSPALEILGGDGGDPFFAPSSLWRQLQPRREGSLAPASPLWPLGLLF